MKLAIELPLDGCQSCIDMNEMTRWYITQGKKADAACGCCRKQNRALKLGTLPSPQGLTQTAMLDQPHLQRLARNCGWLN